MNNLAWFLFKECPDFWNRDDTTIIYFCSQCYWIAYFYSEYHSTDIYSMSTLKFYCREKSCSLNKLEWIKFGIIDYHRTLLTFFCYSKRVILQIVNLYTHHDTVSCLFFILQSIITSFRLIISSRNPKSYKGVTICLCFFNTSFVGLT